MTSLASLALPGCAQILGADVYDTAPQTQRLGSTKLDPTPDSSVVDSMRGQPPSPPYLTGATCEACLSNACSTQEQDCSGDDYCQSWLADMRAHPDPLSAYSRFRRQRDELWNASHGGSDASVHAVSLADCATASCLDECTLGRDFSCVGSFEWQTGFPSALRTRVADVGGNATPWHWNVRACLANDPTCTTPVSTAFTDDDGFATLAITRNSGEYVDFGGFLWFDAPDPTYDAWTTVLSRPFVSNDYTPWQFPSHDTVGAVFAMNGAEFDETLGYVWVIPEDCRGLAAKAVYLEVTLDTPAGPAPCDSCRYTYEDNTGTPQIGLSDYHTAGRVGFISFVPLREVTVAVRETESNRLVGLQRVAVTAKRIMFVKIQPASKARINAAGDLRP